MPLSPAQVLVLLAAALAAGVLTGFVLALLTNGGRRDDTGTPTPAGRRDRTGLPDRTVLLAELRRRERDRLPATVAIVNLDRLSAVNTQFGYAAGNQLLVLAAGRLQSSAAKFGGSVYALGRDEFALLLPRNSAAVHDDVATVVAQLAPTAELQLLGRTVTVEQSACAGLYGHDRPGDAAVLLRRADTALQHAKDHGPGTVVTWTSDLGTRARVRDQRSYALVCWPDPGMAPKLVIGRDPGDVDRHAARLVTDTAAGWAGLAGRSTWASVICHDPGPADSSAEESRRWLRDILTSVSGSYVRLTGDDVHDSRCQPLPSSSERRRPARHVAGGTAGRRWMR